MATATTLGIDVGTGSTKAALVDPNGRVIVERSARHSAAAEVDVEQWWRSVVRAVQSAVAGRNLEIAGVGLSGQMHGVVLLDRGLSALAPAITWADTRSAGTVAEVATAAEPYRRALANPIVAGMPAVSLRWLRCHRPRLLAATRLAVQPKDWLGARLTGVAVSDPTDASATLLWDVDTDGWHRRLLDALDLDASLLPRIVPSDAVRGHIRRQIADELPIPAGVPVTVGRGDTAAALVGSGAAAGDLPQLSVGTGGQICRIMNAPRSDPTGRVHLFRGPGPRHWYALAATLSAGLALEWVRSLFKMSWAELYDEAFDNGSSGDVVFLPYVAGERTPHLDPDRSAAWAGLRLHHERAHLVRAAFEGVAFALRDAFDALTDVMTDEQGLDAFLLAGAGTQDPRWRQLIANALERPLAVTPYGAGSARGAALSAAVAIGWFDDRPTAVATAGPPTVVTEPHHAACAPGLARFRAVADAIAAPSLPSTNRKAQV